MRRPRVAFVVQRCGDEIAGGAEALCLASARTMLDDWECEILTTCALDARTWANHYPPGEGTIGDVVVRRFAVDAPRDSVTFDRTSARILRDGATFAEQEAWMREQGPYASGLFAHLAEHGRSYDCVFFFSYLYATTYFGLPLVADRAVLVPLAHNEWMLDLRLFDRLFALAARFGFVSEEEQLLIQNRFPNAKLVGSLLRIAIAAPQADARAFREAYGLHDSFILCVGRVEPAKGIDDLFSHFAALRYMQSSIKKLVLAGPVAMTVPKNAGIHALGRISDVDKWNAYAAAEFVVVPSAYESLSLVALEAWASQRAILANGASAVLIGQCRRSNGGLWYASQSEFVGLAATNLFEQANLLGRQGASYVAETFTSERAQDSLFSLLGEVL